ncbi:MAG: aromatic amino acid transport family protein [Nanoarchaeota archaeon]|nr:aromatic amino acid transport family protein [Nanoarchaeota archaeon]
MKIQDSNFLIAVFTLIGTIIGAGFLGIPYVVMKSGFSLGMLNIIVIAIIVCIVMLYLGEITLRTKRVHQLPGYAEKYLGRKGKKVMFLAASLGIYTALVAYLIAEGESISYLLFGTVQYSIHMSFFFWFIMSLISYSGIRALRKGEPLGIMLMFAMIVSISILLINKINPENLSYINLEEIMTPFGVILFAFLGFTAIPELRRILNSECYLMKRSIIVACSISLIVYTLFTLLILGYKGLATPEIATIALGIPFIILAMITMFNAYLAHSIAMMDTFMFDFEKKKARAWLYTVSLPIIILVILKLINKASFTIVMSIGGILSGGIVAILILLMVRKAKLHGERKPEYSIPYTDWLIWVIATLLILGAFFEIISLFS